MTPTEREQKFPEWYLESITKMGVQPDEALVWLDFLLEQGWKLDVCLHEQALGWWRTHTAEFFKRSSPVDPHRDGIGRGCTVAVGYERGSWYIGRLERQSTAWDGVNRFRTQVRVVPELDSMESPRDSTVWAEGGVTDTEFTQESLQRWQTFLQWYQERTLAQATSQSHSRPAVDP